MPPLKFNTSNFKSVPRQYVEKQIEKDKSKIPPVAGYRPKFSFVDKKVTGKAHYGTKKQWETEGKA